MNLLSYNKKAFIHNTIMDRNTWKSVKDRRPTPYPSPVTMVFTGDLTNAMEHLDLGKSRPKAISVTTPEVVSTSYSDEELQYDLRLIPKSWPGL